MKLRSWLMTLVVALAFAPAASADKLTIDSSGILRGPLESMSAVRSTMWSLSTRLASTHSAAATRTQTSRFAP